MPLMMWVSAYNGPCTDGSRHVDTTAASDVNHGQCVVVRKTNAPATSSLYLVHSVGQRIKVAMKDVPPSPKS